MDNQRLPKTLQNSLNISYTLNTTLTQTQNVSKTLTANYTANISLKLNACCFLHVFYTLNCSPVFHVSVQLGIMGVELTGLFSLTLLLEFWR